MVIGDDELEGDLVAACGVFGRDGDGGGIEGTAIEGAFCVVQDDLLVKV
jgi:hypothetical protein